MKAHDFEYEMTQTSAIFGRDAKVKVVFQGDGAATDKEHIYLPSFAKEADLDDETVRLMRGYVDHEAGHLRHSDMNKVLSFYKQCQNANMESLQHLHNCLEDIWMEDRVMEDYPGSIKNLTSCNNHVKDRELEFLKEVKKEQPKELSELNASTACLSISTHGRKDLMTEEKTNEVLSYINPRVNELGEEWAALARKCNNSGELIDLAKAVYKYLQENPEGESDFNPEDNNLPMPAGGKGDEEHKATQEIKGKGTGQPMPSRDDIIKEKMKEASQGSLADGPDRSGYRVFTTKFDTVTSIKDAQDEYRHGVLKRGSVASYEEQKAKVASTVNVIKSRIRRALLSKDRRDWDSAKEYGRLDSRRLAAASMGVENVFKTRKDREEMDTAVSVLVDLSGSMSGSKEMVAGQVVITLAECFEGTGVAFSVTGWDNYYPEGAGSYYGRQPEGLTDDSYYHRIGALRMLKFKDFDERLYAAKPALSGLSNAADSDNSDYDAILWQYQQLKKRKEKKKVLIVLSDGHPAHGSHNVSKKSIHNAIKNLVKDVEKSGIKTLGIGIQSTAVKEFYPNHVVVNNLSDLAGEALNHMNRILLSGKVSV